MIAPPPVGHLTRAFLFADLRGYPAFVERHGDAAGADLIDRYRALVRDVVGRSGGADRHRRAAVGRPDLAGRGSMPGRDTGAGGIG